MGGALLGLVAVLVSGIGLTNPSYLIGIPAFGFLLPTFMPKRRIKARQHRIRAGLADGFDLTVICVEAGLWLKQAMSRVGEDLRDTHPDLSDEFSLVSHEMHTGLSWDEALCNLSDRTGIEDIRALTQEGILGLVQAMCAYSSSLRIERCQSAKAAPKMVLALVVFVLPSMFLVTLGPAVIGLIKTLKGQ